VPGTDAARIGLAGDAMLGRSVNERWQDGPPAGVWGGLADRLRGLDGLVTNLECCLSTRGTRKDRVYTFRADPGWAIPALEAAGTTAVSLANNHVLDFGPTALGDTIAHLAGAGIGHAGAGPDRDAALDPATVEVGGVEVAIVGLTDRAPAYAAASDRPGTAFASLEPADPVSRQTVDAALERARAADPDLLVASLHWGPNWETRPSSAHRRQARSLIDRGVDVVHGHSAHVVQGVEVYRGRPIVYDAGDFVDDYVHKPDLHNERSFLFELVVADGHLAALELVPIEIAEETVAPAGSETAAWLREAMRRRSRGFGTDFDRRGAGLRVRLADC
jgi:poly-gamma-glutamate synthesis protein (capsule biosynthesis protein)